MYRDVTLAPDDIEWILPDGAEPWDDHDNLKAIVWSDAEFDVFLTGFGLEATLEKVTRFHRVIANQLIEAGVVELHQSRWGTRTINLCKRVKRRRQQVRRLYQDEHGQAAACSRFDQLDSIYPRAKSPV